MSTEICLCIEEDGTMAIKVEEKEAAPEQEQMEGGQKTPVKTIEEALSMIKTMAEQASMGPPADGMATDDAGLTEDPAAAGQEDQAMQDSYRKGVVQ